MKHMILLAAASMAVAGLGWAQDQPAPASAQSLASIDSELAADTAAASAEAAVEMTDPQVVPEPTPELSPQQVAVREVMELDAQLQRGRLYKPLRTYYEKRQYRPVWFGSEGSGRAVQALLEQLEQASAHGLYPEEYGVSDLRKWVAAIPQNPDAGPRGIAFLDLRLSKALLEFANDLAHGRVTPQELNPKWRYDREPVDLSAMLDKAASGGVGLAEDIAALAPTHEGYINLQRALQRYRQIRRDETWVKLPPLEGKPVREGDLYSFAPHLRKRLAASGDLPASSVTAGTLFDRELAEALRKFQARAGGLDVDGILGKNTIKALNEESPAQNLHRIAANMDRWRWMPRQLKPKRVIVNIPEYMLYAYENDGLALQMRVIVGTSYDGRNTPLFSETMKYVIFRPYWNVPPKIAAKELVPKAWANPYYFANNDYEIVSEYGDSGRVHPVTAASLRAVADGKLKLRQRTGQHNALGRIKFLFPNEFSVYLHDTPSRHLFERRERDFSHGCIRVQNPADLAAFVLSDQPEWTRERIESHLHGNKQKQANLKTPVEVYIGYWTVSADAEGNARFFEDIYGYDARMMQLSGKS